MAMSHADCTHPRTPAGRAACRAGRTTSAPAVVRTGGGKGVQFDVEPRTARGPRPVRVVRNETPGNVLAGGRIPADMPPALADIVRLADGRGWTAKIGTRYNPSEKRVVVVTSHGELSLVWKASDNLPVWGVFFRAADSSITRRIRTVNGALRLAAGEEE